MCEVKTVIVFGGTGTAGLSIVKRALKEKLEVTVFARNPSKVPPELRKSVKIINGNVKNKEEVEDAVEGHDAVLSAIGTGLNFSRTTVISDGCKHIVSGMKKHGVKKLVFMSVAFLLPGRSPLFFLKKVTDDHRRQLEFLKTETENIDWIAVASPRVINDDQINDTYKVEKGTLTGRDKVTAGECAKFMVTVLNDQERFTDLKHHLAGISSGPKKKGLFSQKQ